MNETGQWRVQVTRNGKFYFSWHATKAEALSAAKDQRARDIWSTVRVSYDSCGPVAAMPAQRATL